MRLFLDTEKRLRLGEDMSFVSPHDAFGEAVRKLCPWHLELGRVKTQDKRRMLGTPEHEYIEWEGDVILRLSMPGVILDEAKIQFVANNTVYSDQLDFKKINRKQIEKILNDMAPISTHGGVKVEGKRCATGSMYRVLFNELGAAPSLEWMTTASSVTVACCETQEAITGCGGRWVYDVWLPDTPNLEWYLADKEEATPIEIIPLGPSFSGNGAQIDRIVIDATATGDYVLQVPGDDPTDPIPVDASPSEVLAALNAVSIGSYTQAKYGGSNIIDLIHTPVGIQTPVTVDDIYMSVADLKEATIAHSNLLADNKLSGEGKIKIEILNQKVTETNAKSATTTEILYSAMI